MSDCCLTSSGQFGSYREQATCTDNTMTKRIKNDKKTNDNQ